MPRAQEMVVCPPEVWTELTANNTANITFQVVTGSVRIRVTADATPPAANAVGWEYHSRPADNPRTQGETRALLADFANAISSGRVFARPISGKYAKVIVDHA